MNVFSDFNRLRGLLLSLCVLISVPRFASAAEPVRPNIVLIISDDQAWTDYGFMGHKHIRTPNLDRLAAESQCFTRGYVPSSLCCPSLASMITGLYPHQHKITSNDPPQSAPRGSEAYLAGRRQFSSFMEQAHTLPRILAQHGYLSFQTGKWWQGHFSSGGFTHGMSLGDESKGGRHGDAGLDIGRKTMFPMFDFMERSQKQHKPFFLWYAPMLPHDPHTPPKRLAESYQDKAPSPAVADYWAMVQWFDETCGELLTRIERSGEADNTIVIYLADNGWIQDPAAKKYAPKSKQSPYDGGLRTPILIRWPGKIKPQKSSELAMSIDLAPTILAALGIKPPADLPGVNLLDTAAVAQRKTIFGECFTHNAVDLQNPAASLRWRWMIDGDDKLIVPDGKNEKSAPVELYRITQDPHEEKNLAAEQKPRVDELMQKLDAWWNPQG